MQAMQLSNMPPVVPIETSDSSFRAGQYANMPVSERCVPEFEMQAATMDKQVEELHQFVEALTEKLKPVLRPPTPTADKMSAQAPDGQIAPIADYLRDKNRGIRTVLDKLSYLLNERIDL